MVAALWCERLETWLESLADVERVEAMPNETAMEVTLWAGGKLWIDVQFDGED